uniref:Ig-like domain-containing protein n=1 Tax=Neogobius melanostomus TaxID=47308 RepID=A0A8C6SY95_9GOBI
CVTEHVNLFYYYCSTPASLKVANVGDSVTLECSFGSNSVAVMFYWYKQILGRKPEILSRFYKHDKNSTFLGDFGKDPRLALQNTNYRNHLVISNLRPSDSATYYCVSGYSYVYTFVESVTVMVKAGELTVKSWANGSKSQPGRSVTLQCLVEAGNCDGRGEVYWLRSNGGDSQVGLLHSHGYRCEKATGNPPNSCVYSLPIHHVNSEQTGTYYCAVAACGQVLFGDGIPVRLQDPKASVVVYALSAALAFTALLAVLLSMSALRMMQMSSTFSTHLKNTTERPALGDIYYAALRPKKSSRSRVQRDDTWSECVYSEVRQCVHIQFC